MKHISLIKTKKDYEIEKLKRELESRETARKHQLYENMAWSHAILRVAMDGKISVEAQKLIYDLKSDEMASVYKRLL